MINKVGRVVDEAVEAASLYTQAELDLFKLRLAKAIAMWSARLMSGFVALLCVVLVLMFLGLAAGMYLQTYFMPGTSYLLVSLGFVLIGFIFFLFRKKLIEPLILRSTLKEMFDES